MNPNISFQLDNNPAHKGFGRVVRDWPELESVEVETSRAINRKAVGEGERILVPVCEILSIVK